MNREFEKMDMEATWCSQCGSQLGMGDETLDGSITMQQIYSALQKKYLLIFAISQFLSVLSSKNPAWP